MKYTSHNDTYDEISVYLKEVLLYDWNKNSVAFLKDIYSCLFDYTIFKVLS